MTPMSYTPCENLLRALERGMSDDYASLPTRERLWLNQKRLADWREREPWFFNGGTVHREEFGAGGVFKAGQNGAAQMRVHVPLISGYYLVYCHSDPITGPEYAYFGPVLHKRTAFTYRGHKLLYVLHVKLKEQSRDDLVGIAAYSFLDREYKRCRD